MMEHALLNKGGQCQPFDKWTFEQRSDEIRE